VAWDETRKQARRLVHQQFAVPATYTAPLVGAVPVPCMVRLHTQIARAGDLDREGYGEVVIDISRVVFLQEEVTPARLGLVTMASGRQFSVDLVIQPDDDVIVVCEVKPK
jgi:hypothetical protein